MPALQALFANHGLLTWQDWWTRDIQWYEAPNQRRGGWSGVGQLVLQDDDGGQTTWFVKKQQNHGRRTWRHPLTGEPTFRREWQRLQALSADGIGVPQAVMYAEKHATGTQQAILVTKQLADYQDLDQILQHWSVMTVGERRGLLSALATQLRQFHDYGWVHRALYPKHIFVCRTVVPPQMALIDLEKTRQTRCAWRRARFDLAALQRHTVALSRHERLYFFRVYMGATACGAHAAHRPLRWWARALLNSIVKRSRRG